MKRIAVILLGLLLVTGCAQAPAEEVKVITQETGEANSYSFVAVKRGTVTNEIAISCKYAPKENIDCFFTGQEREIAEVLVEKGDLVKKGQVIARQNVEEFEEKILEEQHAIEMDQLTISQLQEMKTLDLEMMKKTYEFQDEDTRDAEEYQKNVEKATRQYDDQMVDCQDDITVRTIRVQEYQDYIREGTLTAPATGIVTVSNSDLVGEISKPSEEIITMIRNEDLVFESTELEKEVHLEEGKNYHVVVQKGEKQRSVEVVWAPGDEDPEKLFFKVQTPNLHITVGDEGVIWIEKEKKEGVLYLPSDVLYVGAGKSYVYIMGENGIKKIRYVKTGISDRENTEILEGLEEGDYVLRG